MKMLRGKLEIKMQREDRNEKGKCARLMKSEIREKENAEHRNGNFILDKDERRQTEGKTRKDRTRGFS